MLDKFFLNIKILSINENRGVVFIKFLEVIKKLKTNLFCY